MSQKSNSDFKEKYPYIRAATPEPMRIKDILNKTLSQRGVLEYE